MRGYDSNITALFSNLNKGTTFGGFNLSDYASIKNGSYGKLVKAYYTEQNKSNATDKTSTTKTSNTATADTTGMTQMKSEADGLKAAANALGKEDLWKQTDGEFNTEKITSALKSFVKGYNDTLTQASKINSKEVSTDLGYMTSMTSVMSKSLAQAGISVGFDGTLSLNEDTLKKADMNSVKSLFTGQVSYGSQTADKAAQISKDTLMNTSTYNANASLASPISGMFNQYV